MNGWYATKIGREWNVPHDGVGFVREFDVDAVFPRTLCRAASGRASCARTMGPRGGARGAHRIHRRRDSAHGQVRHSGGLARQNSQCRLTIARRKGGQPSAGRRVALCAQLPEGPCECTSARLGGNPALIYSVSAAPGVGCRAQVRRRRGLTSGRRRGVGACPRGGKSDAGATRAVRHAWIEAHTACHSVERTYRRYFPRRSVHHVRADRDHHTQTDPNVLSP